MGPNTIVEAMDPERVDPPVQGEKVPESQSSQLESREQNTFETETQLGNLANLIEEAKKRTEGRKKKGDERRRSKSLTAYDRVVRFEEIRDEKGRHLDHHS